MTCEKSNEIWSLGKVTYDKSNEILWSILNGLWINLDGFGHHFSMILPTFLQRHLLNTARNEITENVKNVQITADNLLENQGLIY